MSNPRPINYGGVVIGGMSPEDRQRIIAEINAWSTKRQARLQAVRNLRQQAGFFKDIIDDWKSQRPPYELPQQPAGTPTLANLLSFLLWLRDRDDYLWQHEVRLSDATVAIADAVVMLAEVLEQAVTAYEED